MTLNHQEATPEGVTFDKKDVLQGFCLLLDGQVYQNQNVSWLAVASQNTTQADDYNAHLVGDFVWSIWGIGAGEFKKLENGSQLWLDSQPWLDSFTLKNTETSVQAPSLQSAVVPSVLPVVAANAASRFSNFSFSFEII